MIADASSLLDPGSKSPLVEQPTRLSTPSPVRVHTAAASKKAIYPMIQDIRPGSRENPFRMLIVGGGPAGTSIIVRAIRLGFLSEICGGSGSSAGVCIVESGPASRLGGGKLLDYQINSNTWGDKFATNVTVDKPSALPPEQVTGTPLESLRNSKSAQRLIEAGNSCVPLNLVGEFLSEVGAVVKKCVEVFSSSRVICDSSVTGIQQVQLQREGEAADGPAGVPPPKELWRVNVARKSAGTCLAAYIAGKNPPGDGGCSEVQEELYAETVVLACGGAQPIGSSLHPLHEKKTLSSDFVCTNLGVERMQDMLLKSRAPPGGSLANKDRKIVIIGGSHSAFSAAWICLNKLDPQLISFSNGSICMIHRSPVLVFYPTRRDAEIDGYTDIKHVNRNGQIHPFGGIRGDAKQLYRQIRNGKEQRVRMLLLKGGSDAPAAAKLMDDAAVVIWACGYTTNTISVRDFAGVEIPLKRSFGQVEVDDNAKVLRDPVMTSCEANTTMGESTAFGVDTSSSCSQENLTSSAAQIRSPVSPIAASKTTTPVIVTALKPLRRQLIQRPEPVINLFATGLGYGLQATFDNGEPDGASGRADGVAVYLKRSATLILSALLGTKVFGDNATSWKERIAQGLAQAAAVPKQRQFTINGVVTVGSPTRSPVRPMTSPVPSLEPAPSSTPAPLTPAKRSTCPMTSPRKNKMNTPFTSPAKTGDKKHSSSVLQSPIRGNHAPSRQQSSTAPTASRKEQKSNNNEAIPSNSLLWEGDSSKVDEKKTEFPLLSRPGSVIGKPADDRAKANDVKPMFNGNRLGAPAFTNEPGNGQFKKKSGYIKQYMSSSLKNSPASRVVSSNAYAPQYVLAKPISDTSSRDAFVRRSGKTGTVVVHPPFGVRALMTNATVNPYSIPIPLVKAKAKSVSSKAHGSLPVSAEKTILYASAPSEKPVTDANNFSNGASNTTNITTMILTSQGLSCVSANGNSRSKTSLANERSTNLSGAIVLSPIRPDRSRHSSRTPLRSQSRLEASSAASQVVLTSSLSPVIIT